VSLPNELGGRFARPRARVRWVAIPVLAFACSGAADRAPRGGATSSSGGSHAPGSGSGARRSAGGSEPSGNGEAGAGGAGQATGGALADAGEAGRTEAPPNDHGGAAGAVSGAGGDRGEADPGPLPDPLCARETRWDEELRLSISTPDDDRLQGVTPDALTLLFEAGGHFYVADRVGPASEFTGAVEVAEGLGFSSLTLSADGLRVVGATARGLSEISRPARDGAFGSEPDETSFMAFNAAVNGTPTNEVALEPVLGMADSLLVYSFVSPSNEDARPTLFASEWIGEWPFGQALGGQALLWAAGQERRVASGLSSDGLTLFYRDEVAQEFRSAWRRRLAEPFTAFESLGNLASATPDGDCKRLFYSAESAPDGDLDLFVADAL
jgi:hypothetical protein